MFNSPELIALEHSNPHPTPSPTLKKIIPNQPIFCSLGALGPTFTLTLTITRTLALAFTFTRTGVRADAVHAHGHVKTPSNDY